MPKRLQLRVLSIYLTTQVIAGPAAAAELTLMETRWLQAASPVLAYARSLDVPIDIVVQPRSGPNDVPMAMGFAGKRCKLVLSLRGATDVESILASVPAAQHGLLIETMAAHEIAHCWRYAQGAWHALPAGFVDTSQAMAPMAREMREMREMRREEGYSDLVALAWVAQRHPKDYAAVHQWLHSVRTSQTVPGGGHDTGIWVALASNPASLGKSANPFEAVDAVWRAGLLKMQ